MRTSYFLMFFLNFSKLVSQCYYTCTCRPVQSNGYLCLNKKCFLHPIIRVTMSGLNMTFDTSTSIVFVWHKHVTPVSGTLRPFNISFHSGVYTVHIGRFLRDGTLHPGKFCLKLHIQREQNILNSRNIFLLVMTIVIRLLNVLIS